MNLKVLLYKWKGKRPQFEKTQVHFVSINNEHQLKQQLNDQEFDLIALGDKGCSVSIMQEIYQEFQIPFWIPKNIKTKKMPFFSFNQQSELKWSDDLISCIRLHHQLRQAKRDKAFLNLFEKFEAEIPLAQDQFVAAALKHFFHSVLNLSNAEWVSLQRGKTSTSPLLLLMAGLQKKKQKFAELISDLESYESECHKADRWQIWEDQEKNLLALIWFEGRNRTTNCLVLNKIQKTSVKELVTVLNSIDLLMQKRWQLCLHLQDQERLTYLDSLTNLYNQKYLNKTLDRKIEENRRYKTPFSVLFIDIDYFKQVNDSLGHVVGSDVLKQLGKMIQGQIRGSDYAFRYGGDEFIVLLSHTQGDPAQLVAERIRNKVEGHRFQSCGHEISITVSIGLAFFPEHANSAEEIIRIADEAMYYGKNVSRNIVYKAS